MDPKALEFEHSRRWHEIGQLLFPEPTAEQQQALALLEDNMRDLEDYLPGAESSPGIGATTWESRWGPDVYEVDATFHTLSSITLTVTETTSFACWAVVMGQTDTPVALNTRLTMQIGGPTAHIGPYATITPQATNDFYFELYTHGVSTLAAGTYTFTIDVREEDGAGTDYYVTNADLMVMTTTLGA